MSSELHLVPSILLQNEDFTEETIRFGMESVYIDSWVRRRIYDAFKEIMESGVRHHLQVRHVLRNNGSQQWNSRFYISLSMISSSDLSQEFFLIVSLFVCNESFLPAV